MLALASASPRRRELLALLGLPFTVTPSRFEEPPAPDTPVDLPDLVVSLAIAKALEVAGRLRDDSLTVIGADTLVTLSSAASGIPLGKPLDRDDAARMLGLLSGNTHYVYTGISLTRWKSGGAHVVASSFARTGVKFRVLSAEMIAEYVATGEPMDKAGAYGAQGYAAPYIAGFEGDFFNVVGLPLHTLGLLLEQIGIGWWQMRKSLPQIIG